MEIQHRHKNKYGGGPTGLVQLETAIKAKLALRKFKKPKPMSHDHDANMAYHKRVGTLNKQWRYVLMQYDSEGSRKVLFKGKPKALMLTRLEAWIRNEELKGMGFAWALCQG